MGILIGLILIVLVVIFIIRQFNSDGITGKKLKKYLLYIIILFGILIFYIITKLYNKN